MARQSSSLTLSFLPAALRDRRDIWAYNAERYNADHADDYLAFIDRETQQLANDPTKGKLIPARAEIRALTIRQGRGAGYYAVYRIKGETIEIARYLHTARDMHGMAKHGEL